MHVHVCYVTVHSHVIGARLLIGVHKIYGPITIITILQLFSSLAHDPPRCHPYDHHTPTKPLVARQQRTNLYMLSLIHI